MEFALSQQALQTGANMLNSKLDQVNYGKIRKYFDISNSYLIEKIILLVFPFYKNEITFGPSIYRPDLYIPAMSFISLILFKGLSLGLTNKFHPEALGISFSRTLFIHIGLCLVYKTAAYFLDASIEFLDLICFSGYKYFIVILVRIIKQIYFGQFLSIYFFVAYFFFMSRSLKNSLVTQNSSKKNIYLLFGIVAVDIVIAMFLSY